jgi:phosphatidylglycerophosphatase A
MTETRIATPLIAILLAWILHWTGGFPLLAIATIALSIYGWSIRPARNNLAVADLIAGQWLALWALSGGLWFAEAAPYIFPYPGWIGAWIMYLAFLWLWSGRDPFWRHILAGAASAAVTLMLAAISHGWLT